jgi:hypothetical protein
VSGSFVLIAVLVGLVLLFALLGLRWANRYVFAPRFTNRACEAFINQVLAGTTLDALSRDHSQDWEFEGRRVVAHWISRPASPPDQGLVVEFDVHPSTYPWSFSRSTFISIRDEEHLSQLRERAKELAQNGVALGSLITHGEESNGRGTN